MGGELAQLESQLEAAIHDALAAALEAKWPVSRWPIYVFTGEGSPDLQHTQRCFGQGAGARRGMGAAMHGLPAAMMHIVFTDLVAPWAAPLVQGLALPGLFRALQAVPLQLVPAHKHLPTLCPLPLQPAPWCAC